MAARDLTGAMAAAIQAGTVYPAIFYEGEFVNPADETQTFLRLWSGVSTITWNGQNWTGAGNLLGISGVRESTGLRANAFEVWLTGMSSALISTALSAARKNRSGKLWLALFDASRNLLADPYLQKRGRLDTIPIEDSGTTARIAARYEDRLAAPGVPRERRYTSADQALRDPADKGFEYVEALQDAVFILPPGA
jgi:hypothetical protein